MYHRIILLLVFVVVVPADVDAKCVMQKYSVIGRIAAEASLLQGIRVYPFLEGTEVTEIATDGTGQPTTDFVIPSSEGSFAVDIWLSTDSGGFSAGRDVCSRKAKYVDLFIAGEGIRAKRVQVTFAWPKGMAPRGDAGIIEVDRAGR